MRMLDILPTSVNERRRLRPSLRQGARWPTWRHKRLPLEAAQEVTSGSGLPGRGPAVAPGKLIPRSSYGHAHAKLNVAVLTFFPAPFVALAEKSPETLVNFMSDGQFAMKSTPGRSVGF